MGNLWQIAVVVVLAAVLLPAANIAYDQQATTTDVSEQMTVETGASTTVDTEASVYSDDVTITTTDDFTELEEGSDYRWDAAFGSVYWPENSTVSDGETVQIEYSYSESDQHTDGVATIIGSVGWVIWVLVFMTILGALMTWIGLGSGGGW